MGEIVLREVPLEACRLSRFNTRKTRPREQVERLAERIGRNGFERTRALWAVERDGTFEIFAGGTRLEAAHCAKIATVPVLVHVGFSDDEVARRADIDNENDEYHAVVPVIDVWAEYHRLAKDEGWTQQRIADAKGCDVPTVSRRVKWHTSLPKAARKATCDGIFDEGHLIAFDGVSCDITNLNPWLTTEQAQTELVAEVLSKHRGSSEGIKPTVKVVREAAARWKALIGAATAAHASLSGEWAARFVGELAAAEARTEAAVTAALNAILRAKKAAEEDEARRLREQADEADAEASRLEAESDRLARIEALTAGVRHGDARALIAAAPAGFHLLLTDPPYGVEYQSGRRTTSAKKAAIANDGKADALALLRDVLAGAFARMADDAHALVFTGWRNEPEFRAALEVAGFVVKGSLVWVKSNHGTGDLEGAFAPKHERILHAVKGKPALRKRHPDVLAGKDAQNSEHPTEKPRDLLRTLIEATTDRGQVVVDPFAGSGGALLEAHAAGRGFWGCELDEAWYRRVVDAVHGLASAEAA